MKVDIKVNYKVGDEFIFDNGAVIKMIGPYNKGKSISVCLTCIQKDPELWGMMRDRSVCSLRKGQSSCGCSTLINYSSLQLKILKIKYNEDNAGLYSITSTTGKWNDNVTCHCTKHDSSRSIPLKSLINGYLYPCVKCGEDAFTKSKVGSRGFRAGSGAISDADYPVAYYDEDKNGVRYKHICPYYSVWSSMICRCYNSRRKAYETVTVCDEWLVFSQFKIWMEKQVYIGLQLDKDLLQLGVENKVYSPDTCIFIEKSINVFFKSSPKTTITGALFDKSENKYRAVGKFKGKSYHLGRYDTPHEAHSQWQIWKIGIIRDLIKEPYLESTIKALNYALVKLEYEHNNNIITKWL